MGYCNAVEEELKQSMKNKYLEFIHEKHYELYMEESKKLRVKGILYYIANLTTDIQSKKLWKHFVTARMPEFKDFLLFQLPSSINKLKKIRNRAAHGEILERGAAEKARKLVLGAWVTTRSTSS